MRITAEEKEATRERIEAAALELFRTRGFEATTTRDIAKAAQIATGTLFNYFAAKEAIVAALAEEGLAKAQAAAEKQPAAETLEEDLFALVAAELATIEAAAEIHRPRAGDGSLPAGQRDAKRGSLSSHSASGKRRPHRPRVTARRRFPPSHCKSIGPSTPACWRFGLPTNHRGRKRRSPCSTIHSTCSPPGCKTHRPNLAKKGARHGNCH